MEDFKFAGEELSKENMTVMLQLAMIKEKEGDMTTAEELKNDFSVQMLSKRIKAYELPFIITDFFLVMSVMTFAVNPGLLMILLRLCYQEYVKNGTVLFDLTVWSMNMFPMGTPTEESLKRFWEEQKESGAPLGNALDDVDNWKII